MTVDFMLAPAQIPAGPRQGDQETGSQQQGDAGRGDCSGRGFKLSVMANQVNCMVTVGKTELGVAPLFKKDAPVGNCEIRIVCPSGKKWVQTRSLKSGGEDKLLILKDSDWSN